MITPEAAEREDGPTGAAGFVLSITRTVPIERFREV
jgi:hypothetical protein